MVTFGIENPIVAKRRQGAFEPELGSYGRVYLVDHPGKAMIRSRERQAIIDKGFQEEGYRTIFGHREGPLKRPPACLINGVTMNNEEEDIYIKQDRQ